MSNAIEAITELANRNAHILEPFRQYLAEYFEYVAEEKGIYSTPLFIRPLIGLKLDVDGGKRTLAVRPGWKKAVRHATENDPGIPGEFQPKIITLELVPELRLKLAPESRIAIQGRIWANQTANAGNLRTICEAADSLLRNPLARFGQQADRCVCCRRALTDLTSRTRGIGPECVKWFSFFENDNPITRKYRTEYRDIFADFEITADVSA